MPMAGKGQELPFSFIYYAIYPSKSTANVTSVLKPVLIFSLTIIPPFVLQRYFLCAFLQHFLSFTSTLVICGCIFHLNGCISFLDLPRKHTLIDCLKQNLFSQSYGGWEYKIKMLPGNYSLQSLWERIFLSDFGQSQAFPIRGNINPVSASVFT